MKNSGKIRILECIRQGQIGGGESHLLSLVENLDRKRYDPMVLSFTDGPMIEKLKDMKVPVHVIHTTTPFDFRKWGMVRDFCKTQLIDIVHAHGTRANSNVLWAARSLKIPVVYTIHGWSFHQDQNNLIKKVRILGEKYLTSNSDVNISVSESNRQSGIKVISTLKSIVINNGIDQKKFNPNRTFKNVRQELGIPFNSILVLFLARFTSHKQPLILLQSFAQAIKSNQALHLLMVGDGDEKDEAIKWIRENGCSNNVTFSGFREDVPDVLAAADIFVLPSLWEGMPIGLLEAMAMGKAVIGTRVDGTREVIVDGENGRMIGTDNLVIDLSKAILDLADQPNQRNVFGEKAIDTIKHRFNAESMTRQVEKVYEDIYYRHKS